LRDSDRHAEWRGVLKKNLLTVGTAHASGEHLLCHDALHHLMVAPKALRLPIILIIQHPLKRHHGISATSC